MRELQEWVDRHAISAGESAFPLLLGTYTRNGVDYQNSAIRGDRVFWPTILRGAYIDVVDTTGKSRAGVHLYLKTLIRDRQDATFHTADGWTGIAGGLKFQGYAMTDYGFAVGVYAPLTATDTIFVRLLYQERSAPV